MDARAFDAATPVRRRRAHGRRGLWFMDGRGTAGSLAVGAALTVGVFGLNATVGSVGIADGMPAVEASRLLPDVSGPVMDGWVWTLDVPPGTVLPGITSALPLAIPEHAAVVESGPVLGLEESAPVDRGWVSSVQAEAAKEAERVAAAGPRRVLCDDESTPDDLKSMCE